MRSVYTVSVYYEPWEHVFALIYQNHRVHVLFAFYCEISICHRECSNYWPWIIGLCVNRWSMDCEGIRPPSHQIEMYCVCCSKDCDNVSHTLHDSSTQSAWVSRAKYSLLRQMLMMLQVSGDQQAIDNWKQNSYGKTQPIECYVFAEYFLPKFTHVLNFSCSTLS